MNNRRKYLTQIVVVFAISLLGTLLLMTPAKAFTSKTVLPQDEPYRVESFNLSEPGQLDVKTSGGHITVEGSSANTVRVEMYARKNGDNLLPEDIALDNWEVTISQSGNTIQAIAKHKGSNSWNLFGGNDNISISFVVYTPRKIATNLKTSGGHIKTRGLSGEQNLSTSGGHLELANLKGTIKARTSGGHIDISDVQGDLKALTSGGHINIENAEGKLAVKTSGGHIDLANVGGTVKASTSGGSVSADLSSIGESVKLHTSGGNIDIRVPANLGLNLDLHGSYVDTDLQKFSGEVDHNDVEGKLNGGGPKLSATTSGGTVQLDFK